MSELIKLDTQQNFIKDLEWKGSAIHVLLCTCTIKFISLSSNGVYHTFFFAGSFIQYVPQMLTSTSLGCYQEALLNDFSLQANNLIRSSARSCYVFNPKLEDKQDVSH